MKWREFLENWSMSSLKLNIKVLQAEFKPNEQDKQCAWELYIELLTRITTQPINTEDGDEKTALDSIYSLFKTTREILKKNGRGCREFSKLSITVLNQVVRPFTAKWHKKSLNNAFEDDNQCQVFREELAELQVILTHYTQALAKIADVEDLKGIEIE